MNEFSHLSTKNKLEQCVYNQITNSRTLVILVTVLPRVLKFLFTHTQGERSVSNGDSNFNYLKVFYVHVAQFAQKLFISSSVRNGMIK